MNRRNFLTGLFGFSGFAVLGQYLGAFRLPGAQAAEGHFPLEKTDAEWRKQLSPNAYSVLRHEGTEMPGSSPLLDEHRTGTFVCAACAQALFSSTTKFDSHTGWPSFYQPISPAAVGETTDHRMIMARTEVHCSNCGGHLGHVFKDGPKPTGLRYCMNGVALGFKVA